jgi:LPS-assembly lipoprotein
VKIRRFLVLLPLALLAGCGWRLEGSERLPPELRILVVRLAQPYGTFGRRLRDLLEADGARVYLHRKGAPVGAASLRILNVANGQRVVNVNAQGVPAVYEVTFRIVYEVVVHGRALGPPRRIHLSIPYFYQPLAPLAMTEESTRIVHHLEREGASLLVLRLLHLPTATRGPHGRGGDGSRRAEGPPPPKGFPRAG